MPFRVMRNGFFFFPTSRTRVARKENHRWTQMNTDKELRDLGLPNVSNLLVRVFLMH